jgi:hypothetical protein
MTATLGDFLVPARHRISAAALDDDLPAAAVPAVVSELSRLLTVLCRYSDDCLRRYDDAGILTHAIESGELGTLAVGQMLARAAENTQAAASAAARARPGPAHPAAAALHAAGDLLLAGRDLLDTHHDEAGAGSPWADVLTTTPVTTALMRELAGYAQQIAVLATRLLLPAAAHPASRLTPDAVAALGTAARWLIFTGSVLVTADLAQPGHDAGRALLYAIPANTPPARNRPAPGEPAASLTAGAITTARRLTHLVTRSGGPPDWPSPAASASWRHNALAAAIIGHNNELLLRALILRGTELGLPARLQRQLAQHASQARRTWKACQALVRAWDPLTTGTSRQLTPPGRRARRPGPVDRPPRPR